MRALGIIATRLLLCLWLYTGRAEHSDDYIPISKLKPPSSHGRRHHRNTPSDADITAQAREVAVNDRTSVRSDHRKKHRGKNKPASSLDTDSGSSSSSTDKRGSGEYVMPHDMEATMNRYWQRAKQVMGIDAPLQPTEAVSSSTSLAEPVSSSTSPAEAVSSSTSPAEAVPSSISPAEAVPSSISPAEAVSSSTSPVEGGSSSPLAKASRPASSKSAKVKKTKNKDGPLPSISLFPGFMPPEDINTWKIAKEKARSGEQVLLRKVLEVIKTPTDLFHADAPEFKWASSAADIHIGKDNADEKTRDFTIPLKEWADRSRDPVVIFGTRIHQRMRSRKIEGAMTKWSPFGAMEMLRFMKRLKENDAVLSRRIVGIGAMDENWGWLSSHFVNRTVTWGFRFGGGDPFTSPYNEDEIRRFIEDPNLTMFMTNQHHNITNPKVISVPLGIMDVYETWYYMHDILKRGLTKKHLLFSAGSDFGARPYIRECVRKNVGERAFFTFKRKEPKQVFYDALRASKTVLAMPGLGYDTYRLWESLAFGSVPVIERGVGLDRTVYKLPVLLVDDFYDLSAELLEQAYVEAIYRGLRNEWEYQRMKPSWWLEILFNASVSGTADLLMERHPLIGVVDTDFTRPLVPFDCKAMGGCGLETKKTPDPENLCSIYPRKNIDEWRRYKWNWFYD